MIGYRPWPLVKISWLFLTPGLCLVPQPHLSVNFLLIPPPAVHPVLCVTFSSDSHSSQFAWPLLPSLRTPATSFYLSYSACLPSCPVCLSVSLHWTPLSLPPHHTPTPTVSQSQDRSVRVSKGVASRWRALICSCPCPLGYFLLLPEQVHASQIQQCLRVPVLGILHWLVLGSLLHGLRPSLHYHQPPEDPGLLQEGRSWGEAHP